MLNFLRVRAIIHVMTTVTVKIQPREAKAIVDNLFDVMKESLQKGERIEIRGFGSFVMRQYGSYKGRNPKTGEIVDVPPKKIPHFKVGKELRDLVNKSKPSKLGEFFMCTH